MAVRISLHLSHIAKEVTLQDLIESLEPIYTNVTQSNEIMRRVVHKLRNNKDGVTSYGSLGYDSNKRISPFNNNRQEHRNTSAPYGSFGLIRNWLNEPRTPVVIPKKYYQEPKKDNWAVKGIKELYSDGTLDIDSVNSKISLNKNKSRSQARNRKLPRFGAESPSQQLSDNQI